MMQTIQIKDLYKQLLDQGVQITKERDYELLKCEGISIQTFGNKYVPLKWLSRHKTSKHLLIITVEYDNEFSKAFKKPNVASVVVTTDHVCMVYNRDHFFENTNAKNLKVGQCVSVYDEVKDKEVIGTISHIEDLGETNEYVYDCEVDDKMHSFYANDILIHNSQFVNIRCVTEFIANKNNQKKLLHDWPKKEKIELWNTISKFVDDEVNKFVRDLVHDYCHTNETKPLTYELEYATDIALFEGKKHYYIHKMFEEGDYVDKVKMTGISLKKGETSKELKSFLKDCYDGVLFHNWTQQDYEKYISDLYEKFSKLSIDEIAYWRGYTAERNAVGFLQMEVGSTIAARAANFYNQILQKLNLNKKYDSIIVGNKIRYAYIEKSNKYGIDVIAYLPGQWPKEFDQIFKVDYPTMFNKLIIKQLLRYREAAGFKDFDPKKQVLQDIFEL